MDMSDVQLKPWTQGKRTETPDRSTDHCEAVLTATTMEEPDDMTGLPDGLTIEGDHLTPLMKSQLKKGK